MIAAKNQHGVYAEHDDVRLIDGKARIPLAEIRVAETEDGWRATPSFMFTTGNWWGMSSPITDHCPAFPDRSLAIGHAAQKLSEDLSSAPWHAVTPPMESQRRKILDWLAGLMTQQPAQLEMFA